MRSCMLKLDGSWKKKKKISGFSLNLVDDGCDAFQKMFSDWHSY